MKLSAVAAYLVPPRSLFQPTTKATDPSVKTAATAKRTVEVQDTLELSKALQTSGPRHSPTERAGVSDAVAADLTTPEAEGASDGRPAGISPEKAASGPTPGATEELSEEQQQQVTELKQRDAEVRAHEQAHVAAGGPHVTGGPTYEYQEGPDGRQYAVGGEVQIDTSPVDGDPEATLRKAQIVRAAALAPAEPSSQDRAVAAAATQMAMQAQAELQGSSQASQSNEDEAGVSTAEPANGQDMNRKEGAAQTYASQAIAKIIAAQLKTTMVSSVDVYG